YCTFAHRALPSFPTRRSSDLCMREITHARLREDASLRSQRMNRLLSERFSYFRATTSSRMQARWCSSARPTSRVFLIQQTKLSRSEEHTSELQSRFDLVCRLL